jgi:hypothetical protein
VTAADFDVRVVDSSGIDLAPIDADVTITVDPSPPETTTTIDPDNPPPQYSVVFDLVEAERPAAALQFDITHPGLTGGWLGAAGDVDCRWLVTSNARACNDRGNGILSCAVVNSAGLEAPVSILECGFASYDLVLVASDFDVTVVDASGVDLQPIEVFVSASSVTGRQGRSR